MIRNTCVYGCVINSTHSFSIDPERSIGIFSRRKDGRSLSDVLDSEGRIFVKDNEHALLFFLSRDRRRIFYAQENGSSRSLARSILFFKGIDCALRRDEKWGIFNVTLDRYVLRFFEISQNV